MAKQQDIDNKFKNSIRKLQKREKKISKLLGKENEYLSCLENGEEKIIKFWTNVFFPYRKINGESYQIGQKNISISDEDAFWLILSSKNFTDEFTDYSVIQLIDNEDVIDCFKKELEMLIDNSSNSSASNISKNAKTSTYQVDIIHIPKSKDLQQALLNPEENSFDVNYKGKKMNYLFEKINGHKRKLILTINEKEKYPFIVSYYIKTRTEEGEDITEIYHDYTDNFLKYLNDIDSFEEIVTRNLTKYVIPDIMNLNQAIIENEKRNKKNKKREIKYISEISVEIENLITHKRTSNIIIQKNESGKTRGGRNIYRNRYSFYKEEIENQIQEAEKKSSSVTTLIRKRKIMLNVVFKTIKESSIKNIMEWLFNIYEEANKQNPIEQTKSLEVRLKKSVTKAINDYEKKHPNEKNVVQEDINKFIQDIRSIIIGRNTQKNIKQILYAALFESIQLSIREIQKKAEQKEQFILNLASKKVIINKEVLQMAQNYVKNHKADLMTLLKNTNAEHMIVQLYSYENQLGIIGELLSLKRFNINNIIKTQSQGQTEDIYVNGKEKLNFEQSFRDVSMLNKNGKDIGGINVKHYMKSTNSLTIYQNDGFPLNDRAVLLKYLPENVIDLINQFNVNAPYFDETIEKYEEDIIKVLNKYLPQFLRQAGPPIMGENVPNSNLFYQLNTVVVPSSIILKRVFNYSKSNNFFKIINPFKQKQNIAFPGLSRYIQYRKQFSLNLLSKAIDLETGTKFSFTGYTIQLPKGV